LSSQKDLTGKKFKERKTKESVKGEKLVEDVSASLIIDKVDKSCEKKRIPEQGLLSGGKQGTFQESSSHNAARGGLKGRKKKKGKP